MEQISMAGFRRLVVVGAVALAGLAVTPVLAQASGPIHINFSFTIPNDSVCGISGVTAVRGVDNFTPIFDSSGNMVGFLDRAEAQVTFTAANGKSVVVSAAGSTTGRMTLNPDGTTTFRTTFIGLPERISTAHGAVLTRDAGIITFITTVDSEGNLISQTFTESGPHPEAEADFALFCEVITAALA